MKSLVRETLQKFVAAHSEEQGSSTRWESPVVGFCSAADPLFAELRKVVSPTHAVPTDFLPDARTVIAFFIPFPRSLARTNAKGQKSSEEWGAAYVETNVLIRGLSLRLRELMSSHGHSSHVIPATHNWDEEKLISDWSHRHVALIAGLGSFGLNNMLITPKGCCGRLGSFITSAEIEPDSRSDRPACLHKFDGSCSVCVRRCVNEALDDKSFDRFKCYEMCLENVKRLEKVGYADVCGKCLVAVPCAHIDPVATKTRKSPP